ncbi:MAG TPA: DNA polymerase III subunit alpha [Actinomycetota bacterium]|nr:DNA polymerase III subunit alpha [Actinomycetota bacterium]
MTEHTFEPYVHLHCRSAFSLKEGAYLPEELAARAAGLGMPAVALTDRDGLYGAVRFTDACHRAGVKPILGARLTLGEARGEAVVLIARDDRGYANLCRLITAAHGRGERGEPWLSPREVMERAEGLVCLLGPESPPGRLVLAGRPGAAREVARPWREAFGAWCFVEVRNVLEPGSRTEIGALLSLAAEADLGATATNAVRYLVPEDAFLADALECMREIVPVAEHHLTRRNAEGYLKSPAQMRALFAERPDLCDTTVRIAEACEFDLHLGTVHFPDFPTPPGRTATSLLAERCHRGLAARGMRFTDKVRHRLDFELDQIRRMGYSAYFLTVADIVREVKEMGIRCGARGSAAGSLVCYLTGISEVDPVHHDLLFERFINPLREELPDIDIDVESARREEVYERILSRYGSERCACVTMVDTYRARAAVREVGKALGYPEDEIDRVAKAFPHIGANRIRDAMDSLPELRGSNLGAGQLELLFRVAERLNGFPRHLALHPSGIVLSKDDLLDRVPMERSFLEHRMVQADKDDVERLGLLKLDVLGVRLLSSMRHTLGEIHRTTEERVDLDAIPRDDPATFDLIRSSRTIGCFQIESPGQRELLQKLQPERFEDLIVDISLFRPGPVKSDMITPFINRRHGWERPRYAHPGLRPALQETHGVIVYHEQIMRILEFAGYDLAEADRIRRHLDDGGEILALEDGFVEQAVACGLGTADADVVWRELASFASFGFCKAHAAAFAVPTYQSAWLKAHYPAHFLAGVLTHEPGMYPRRLILEDAREHGVEILPLDVNRSEKAYSVEGVPSAPPLPRYGIRLALQDVHGMSDAETASILEARADRPFTSVGDFLRRTRVARPVVEALAHAGAFDTLPGGTRRDRLFVAMTDEPVREGLGVGTAGQQLALPVNSSGHAPGLREYSDAERVRAELEVTALDASRHLLSFYEPLLTDLGVVRSVDLRRHRGDEWVMVAGVKVSSQTPQVRSGQRIIFLTLDDATGPVDVTVFERIQDRCARTVFHGFLLAVWGRLRRTGVAGVSIIAEEVWDLVELDRARREGTLVETMRGRAGPPAGPARKLWHASGGSAG